MPTNDISTLEGKDDLQLSQGVSNRVIYLHMDQFRETSPFVKGNDGSDIKNPLMDQRVRLAISKAISRDVIVDRVMEGVAVPAGQLLPEGFFGVSDKLAPLDYDPEGAKALLAEAGYPDGFQLTIHGPNDRYINDANRRGDCADVDPYRHQNSGGDHAALGLFRTRLDRQPRGPARV